MKFVGMALILAGFSGFAFAGGIAPPAPEIGPASGAGAVALLAGAILVIRGRRKK
jgi:hypothetical protein